MDRHRFESIFLVESFLQRSASLGLDPVLIDQVSRDGEVNGGPEVVLPSHPTS